MLLRNAVVLLLTLAGSLCLVGVTWDDKTLTGVVAAIGCFTLARVYAQITRR
jgi:hypothetical protein